MSFVEFSQEDILRSKLIEPGWYILALGHSSEWEDSKKGDSQNLTVDAKVVQNADNGDTTFAGVPVTIRFNTKAKGFAVGFFSALTGTEAGTGQRYDFAAVSGRKIVAFIGNDLVEGRQVNKVEHKYKTFQE